MRLRRPYKSVTWLTIALFAILTGQSFAGQVLCVGEDNHSQVESIIEFCCDLEDSDSGIGQSAANSDEQTDCGDCSDVNLDQVISLRGNSRSGNMAEATLVAGLVWSVPSISSFLCMGKPDYAGEFSLATAQPQRLASTTILIC